MSNGHSRTGWRKVKTTDVLGGIITGRKDVNQASSSGAYPFFSCARETSLFSSEALLDTEAILIAGNGSYTGHVKKYSGKFDLYQRTYALFDVKAGNDWKFLYYIFKHYFEKAHMGGSSGAAIPYITKPILTEFSFYAPDLATQERIASILSAYDDLIENNRKRIILLEQAARLMYKEWFINFRFPGSESVSFVDRLPTDWQVKTFDDVCQTIGGGTPSTKVASYWEEGDIPWITPTDITRNDCLALLDGEKKITREGLMKSSAKMVPPHTILMTSRASVGFFGLADKEVCTNQGFINIIPHEEWMRYYLLFNLLYRVDEIRSHAGGSTYAEISKSKFRALSVVQPERSVLEGFDQKVRPLVEQVRVLKKATERLTRARDILLPRLMDGRIPV